jgi:hypothetical protein
MHQPGNPVLSNNQHRALNRYKRLLEAASLNPDMVLRVAESNSWVVAPLLRNMTDQVVRGEVILEYTMIDMEFDIVLYQHFFGKNLQAARRRQRFKTLRLILQNLYLLQKLAIVRSFREVPKVIASTIGAVNDLRNGLAHNFFLEHLGQSKRTYKGLNIFTAEGLNVFLKDTSEVKEFLHPEVFHVMRKVIRVER